MSRYTTKDFHLKAIFNLLTQRKIMPAERNAAGRIQHFFPERCAIIRRDALPSYYPNHRQANNTHWLVHPGKRDGAILLTGEQIGFCSLCEAIRTSTRSNYLSGFCTRRKKDAALKWVFLNLILLNGGALLDEMEEKAGAVLERAGAAPGTQLYAALQDALPQWLMQLYPQSLHPELYVTGAAQNPGSAADARQALSSAVNRQMDRGLAAGLSRLLASAAIIGLDYGPQAQALNLIWPAEAGAPASWRELIRQGDEALELQRNDAALGLYQQAEALARSLPNIENLPEYQHLILQKIQLRLMNCKTAESIQGEQRKLDRLCEERPGPNQSRALFLRAQLRERGLGYAQSAAEAFQDYARAADCADAPAEVLLFVGRARWQGSYGNAADPLAAFDDFKRGSDQGSAQCAYHLAMLCEAQADLLQQAKGIGPDFARSCYDRAARGGIVPADRQLRNLQFRSELSPRHAEGDVLPGSICLSNSAQGPWIRAFISQREDFISVVHGDVCALIAEAPERMRYERIVFALLSESEADNVSDAVNLIRYLNDYADGFSQRADWRRCELFVLSTDATAPYILDSAARNLADGIYLKIQLIDPDAYAVDRLLLEQPTLIPCIPAESARELQPGLPRHLHAVPANSARNIAIIGSGRLAQLLAKQIIGCTALSDHPTNLSIIGEDAERLRQRMEEECHGLFSAAADVARIRPSFHACDPSLLPIHRAEGDAARQLQDVLLRANYIAVCTESAELNLRIAIQLRSGGLAHRPSPSARPYITLRYRNASHAWLATRLSVNPQVCSDSWTTDYALNTFGSDRDLAYSRLSAFPLSTFAVRLHKSYYGLDRSSDGPSVDRALRDYYQSSYNRASSTAQALAIIYELFAMGVYFDVRQDYATFSAFSELSAAAECYLTKGRGGGQFDEARVKRAGQIEHERWNGYMLANGWRTATAKDYRAYIGSGHGRHHLEIARLHPYIVPCDRLIPVWEDLNATLRNAPWREKPSLSRPDVHDENFIRIIPDLIVCPNQSVFDAEH